MIDILKQSSTSEPVESIPWRRGPLSVTPSSQMWSQNIFTCTRMSAFIRSVIECISSQVSIIEEIKVWKSLGRATLSVYISQAEEMWLVDGEWLLQQVYTKQFFNHDPEEKDSYVVSCIIIGSWALILSWETFDTDKQIWSNENLPWPSTSCLQGERISLKMPPQLNSVQAFCIHLK